MVSVDVKHHVYLLTYLPGSKPTSSLSCLHHFLCTAHTALTRLLTCGVGHASLTGAVVAGAALSGGGIQPLTQAVVAWITSQAGSYRLLACNTPMVTVRKQIIVLKRAGTEWMFFLFCKLKWDQTICKFSWTVMAISNTSDLNCKDPSMSCRITHIGAQQVYNTVKFKLSVCIKNCAIQFVIHTEHSANITIKHSVNMLMKCGA